MRNGGETDFSLSLVTDMNVRENLDLRQDGEDGGADAEQHVDADEDLVFSATVGVGVVDVEHDQRHQRQQVVDRGDREQGCKHKTTGQAFH